MNQVEVKRRQIQSFSYVLACINIWVFGKSIGDNGLGYLVAAASAQLLRQQPVEQRGSGICPVLGAYREKSAGQNGQNASGQKCQGAVSECLQNA